MLCKHALSVLTFSIFAAGCGALRDEMPRAEEDTDGTVPSPGTEPVGQEVPAEGVILAGPPNAGAIGIVGKNAYWMFRAETGAGIASGSLHGGETRILVAAIDDIHAFDVAARVVYQKSGGSVFVINPPEAEPTELKGSGQACDGVTSDAGHVYCLSGGNVLAWNAAGAEPTLLYAGAPEATSIAVDERDLYIATRSAGTVVRAPKEGGGPFIGEVVTERRSGVARLSATSSDLLWTESGPEKDHDEVWWAPRGQMTAKKIAGGTAVFASDPESRVVFVGASDGGASIERVDLATDERTKVAGGDTVGLGGIAVYERYLYVTARDGMVRRVRK